MNNLNEKTLFIEGYKRETRKSYQLYLDKLMDPKTYEGSSSNCDENSDDNIRRRSKRTPVPKRSFKLIDDYESKETNKKKDKKDESNKTNKKSKNNDIEEANVKDKSNDDEGPVTDDQGESTPRKSSRAPKPKTFTDSIAQPYIKKPQISKEEEKKDTVFISPTEVVKQRRKSSVSESKDANQVTGKRKSSSDLSDQVKKSPKESPTKGRKVAGKRKGKDKVEINIKLEPNDLEASSSCQDSESSPRKKRKKMKGAISEDNDDNLSNHEKKMPTYESYVTTGSKKYVPSDNLEEGLNMNVDVEDGAVQKGKSKTLKRSKKDPPKPSKEEKAKQPKKCEKLIVSFKKKPESKTKIKKKKKKKMKKEEEQLELIPIGEKTSASPLPLDAVELTSEAVPVSETVLSPVETDDRIRKKKKKPKKKLDHKSQKVVDVKIFPVEDDTVFKVKKKKIYKKRNEQKVLVRIIKNHCNKSGEIVKTETVLVDSVPVEDGKDAQGEIPSANTSLNTISNKDDNQEKEIDLFEQSISYEENNDMDYEIEISGTLGLGEVHEIKPEAEESPNGTVAAKTALSKKKKKMIKKKMQTVKKPVKSVKKPLSRPANKNVTVGGKVVGKTTKGMKKTGTASLGGSTPTTPETTKHTIKYATKYIEPASTNSEPKNAYNLFCRKYRPLVVQQHPKADFAEISRRLAALWNTASVAEKQEHRERFNDLQHMNKAKLTKLTRTSPSLWSETEFKFIKKAISEKENFIVPKYNMKRLQPVDLAAHLQLLGDSLTVIAGALEQQSAMTVHGAMSVLLDSILCSMAPLIFMTSQISEMAAIDEEQQARILDNIGYILPGL